MTLTSQDVLKAFERIRVFQRGEQRAVHKPLLILLALARIAQDAPRMVTFEDIEGSFKNLLAEFGPSSAPNSRHYPFWHLVTDGVWQLDGPAPDGHPKLLHCWPVKLLQAGRGDYAGSEVMIRRAAASLSL